MQRQCFSVPWHLQSQQLIFTHSHRESNTAADIVFDQERVLEMLSLTLAYTEIKCISFVSLIVALQGYSFLYQQEHISKMLVNAHTHVYIIERDTKEPKTKQWYAWFAVCVYIHACHLVSRDISIVAPTHTHTGTLGCSAGDEAKPKHPWPRY